ncbi:hypothetical protein J6590_032480 [Homalodisca vitripennis]|nr:hypothetical protein J6590_032480 [Homalodisca vitripennis]
MSRQKNGMVPQVPLQIALMARCISDRHYSTLRSCARSIQDQFWTIWRLQISNTQAKKRRGPSPKSAESRQLLVVSCQILVPNGNRKLKKNET